MKKKIFILIQIALILIGFALGQLVSREIVICDQCHQTPNFEMAVR